MPGVDRLTKEEAWKMDREGSYGPLLSAPSALGGIAPSHTGRYRAGSPLRCAQRQWFFLLLLSNAECLLRQRNFGDPKPLSGILSRGMR